MFLCSLHRLLMPVILLPNISAYRILGISPFNSKSHDLMFEAVTKSLASKGHIVHVITHYPVEEPPKNYETIVNLNGTLSAIRNNITIGAALKYRQRSNEIEYVIAERYGNQVCELLGLPEMQEFIKNLPNVTPYDVLITEVFGASCYLGFGYLLNIPVVALSSVVEYPWISDMIGNFDNLAIVPTIFNPGTKAMDFWKRLKNIFTHYYSVKKFYAFTESQTAAMRKYLRHDMPTIRVIEKTIALTLVNSHIELYGKKPILPSVVPVGGIHVLSDTTQLSPDIQKWMNESIDGVVLFSLGSMVIVETLPWKDLKAIYAAFTNIKPTRILMKILDTKKLPPGLPDNVLTLPWIPQIAILRHKNTRAFITHGGAFGCQEALYFGVPMIGFPISADQPRNIENFIAKNMAVKLNIEKITKESLYAALKSILNDPKYRINAQHHSRLFRDRPMTPSESAVFWIEYVIRNGPHVLKSPALDMSWWQVALLDVYGFVFVMILLVIIALMLLLKYACFKFNLDSTILVTTCNSKKCN